MKPMQFLITFLLTISLETTLASTFLIDQIQHEFKQELYPISRVIPGYQRPINRVPRFSVTEFRVTSNELHTWSQAIAETLRYRIQYAPKVRLYMPAPYSIYDDAQVDNGPERPLLTARKHFQNLNRTLGIETVLTGSISKTENQFNLTTELLDVTSGNIILQTNWQFTWEELPGVLIEITQWVYLALGIGLSEDELDYIRDESTLSLLALQSFVQEYAKILVLEPTPKRELIDQLQTQHPRFALLAAYVISNRSFAQNLDEAYEYIELYERLRKLNPKNAGIELDTYKALDISVMPKHKVAAKIKDMHTLVIENPHDPTMMIELATALLENGASLEGITVMLEAAQRWPENYRVWWTLGWAVNRHAWQVRGNSFWRDVPERAKDQFKALTPLADQIIDQALTLNSHNQRLWNMKINSLGSINGFSDELLEIFDKAVAEGPELKQIYSSTLNYSSKNWRGTPQARRHIIETAEKNNPDASWPKQMRNRYIDDFNRPITSKKMNKWERYFWDFYEHPDFWKFTLIIAFIFLWIVYSFGKWAGRKEIASDYYLDEDEDEDESGKPYTIERCNEESRFR